MCVCARKEAASVVSKGSEKVEEVGGVGGRGNGLHLTRTAAGVRNVKEQCRS